MDINIVCGQHLISLFNKSPYFKKDLGFSTSMDDIKSGERIYSIKDQFAVMYNIKYKTAIYKKGKVGNYAFYLDAYILDDSIATYCDDLEYIIKMDRHMLQAEGVNSYIGFIIRSVIENKTAKDLEISNKEKEPIVIKEEIQEEKSRLLTTPGSVRYEDIQEYLKNKNRI